MFPFFRQIRSERELKSLLWKIDYSEIVLGSSDDIGATEDDSSVRHRLVAVLILILGKV